MKPSVRRCAIYTRKSTEEGLDQAFNSLDAQREACEAYIKSQAHEGWKLVKGAYDDGGFSGGNMERPGLQRLMAEMKQGLIDVVVVFLMPMHDIALFAFVAVQIVRNVMGHAGTEIHPASFGPGRWLGWNNTTTHHDLHHETSRYNYGLYFRWWDKLLGTEHPDYRRKFESIVAPRGAFEAEVRS